MDKTGGREECRKEGDKKGNPRQEGQGEIAFNEEERQKRKMMKE